MPEIARRRRNFPPRQNAGSGCSSTGRKTASLRWFYAPNNVSSSNRLRRLAGKRKRAGCNPVWNMTARRVLDRRRRRPVPEPAEDNPSPTARRRRERSVAIRGPRQRRAERPSQAPGCRGAFPERVKGLLAMTTFSSRGRVRRPFIGVTPVRRRMPGGAAAESGSSPDSGSGRDARSALQPMSTTLPGCRVASRPQPPKAVGLRPSLDTTRHPGHRSPWDVRQSSGERLPRFARHAAFPP